jgi:hypothetical protein
LALLYQQNSNTAQQFAQAQVTTVFPSVGGSVEIYANAGDTIKIQAQGSASTTVNAYLASIIKSTGSNAVQAPANAAFTYYGSTQSISNTYTAMINPTKTLDTMGAYNVSTGLYAAPYTGTYHCDCATFANMSTTGLTLDMAFYVGGVSAGPETDSYNGTAFINGALSLDIPVLAGQNIGCYLHATSTGTATLSASSFSCHRVGYWWAISQRHLILTK